MKRENSRYIKRKNVSLIQNKTLKQLKILVATKLTLKEKPSNLIKKRCRIASIRLFKWCSMISIPIKKLQKQKIQKLEQWNLWQQQYPQNEKQRRKENSNLKNHFNKNILITRKWRNFSKLHYLHRRRTKRSRQKTNGIFKTQIRNKEKLTSTYHD